MNADVDAVAKVVAAGLRAPQKQLPAWLLYDDVGCAIYDEITRLPEYYLTRAEAEIFTRQGAAIVARAAEGADRIALAEIGAGDAKKTQRLLEAVVARQSSCTFVASDIAAGALHEGAARIGRELPGVVVRTVAGLHHDIGPALRAVADRQVLMFIGSSIGNLTDDEAVSLLTSLRAFLRPDAVLLIGTDLKKDPRVMRAAYDDAAGVTARFSLNLLTRLNRELDADFDVEGFRHVAEWNAANGNIEIFIESQRAQQVTLGALQLTVAFAAGERIHTETSAKYDDARVDGIFGRAGFARATSFVDEAGAFAVHLARVA